MKKCKICDREHDRRKYCSEECRLESKRITARKWNKENKGKHAEHQRQHKARDPELFKSKERAYYLRKTASNPGYFVDKVARRDALKKSASPKWLSTEHREQIMWFYDMSAKLTEITGVLHHVDHIEPLQGDISCGLHVPWNLQVLTGSENSAKGNKENRKIVYMLCGQSGVGKTTLTEDFKDIFDVISYDGVTDLKLDEMLQQSTDKIILIDIAIKISTIIKRLGDKYFIRPIFMIEPPEIVSERINGRGGKILNVMSRYNRVVSLSNKYAYYSGNTEEVRSFLSGLKETSRDRYDSGQSTAGYAGGDVIC